MMGWRKAVAGSRQLAPCLGLLLLGWIASSNAVAEEVRELQWQDLRPPGWEVPAPDLSRFFHDPSSPAALQDTEAPIVSDLHDTRVAIRGYVVPLAWQDDDIDEFLFVPWFGACIHVPPPPSNQVILVHMDRALPEVEMFHPQILSGRLLARRGDSELAVAGYQMVQANTRRTTR